MRRRGCLPFSVSALCPSLLCVYLLLVCFVQANMFQVFDKGVSCPRHCCHTQHWGNNALDKDVSPDFYAFRNSVAQILCLYTLEIAVYWWYFRFVVVIWAINSCNAWLWQQDRKKPYISTIRQTWGSALRWNLKCWMIRWLVTRSSAHGARRAGTPTTCPPTPRYHQHPVPKMSAISKCPSNVGAIKLTK